MSLSSQFQHHPLHDNDSAIRIFRVMPSRQEGSLIECAMCQAEITKTEYVCLSYCWGPEDSRKKKILINGASFYVRENLWNFLKIAETKYTSLLLWVDALRIDQTNIQERNHQVQQMGSIYSHAQQVIAWLGSDASMISEKYPEETMIQSGILYHMYWSRAWVTQELVLCKNVAVVVGPTEVKLADLIKKATVLRSDITWFGQLVNFMKEVPRGQRIGLACLLWKFRFKECSHPQDRIYSLLSLSTEEIGVDYTLSKSALMYRVLLACTDWSCLSAAVHVAQALGPWQSSDLLALEQPWIEIDIEDPRPHAKNWSSLALKDQARCSLICCVGFYAFRRRYDAITDEHIPYLGVIFHQDDGSTKVFEFKCDDGSDFELESTPSGSLRARIAFRTFHTTFRQVDVHCEMCVRSKDMETEAAESRRAFLRSTFGIKSLRPSGFQ